MRCGHFGGFGHGECFGKVGCASIGMVLSAFAVGDDQDHVYDDIGEL